MAYSRSFQYEKVTCFEKIPKCRYQGYNLSVLVHCDISATGRYGAHTMLTGAC